MPNLKQLEEMQKSFNVVVEHGRSLMKDLYSYAAEKNIPPMAISSHHEFYVPRLPAFVKKYRAFMSLINTNQYNDEILMPQLWRAIKPERSFVKYKDNNYYDECEFIIALCFEYIGSLPDDKQKNFYLTYTGCLPNFTDSLDEAPIRNAIPIKVSGLHRRNLRLTHPEYTTLLNKIDLLRLYGCIKGFEIDSLSNKITGPGVPALDIADDLYQTIEAFLISGQHEGTLTRLQTTAKIENLLKVGRKNLGNDRNAIDIIAHIALACTGIGLAVIFVNWCITDSLFLNKTNRQIIVEQITEASRLIFTAG